ncbi:unnamed protein product [Phytophthora fragariaefolia]|uniref:Unnamed protein product n=1 Tax=Phytophthora fragariaefolia TaxID=1490495 RepID=A0A9W6XP62_9STRA|nr:unnamed protein product [Phytophthora fragariaefolia]
MEQVIVDLVNSFPADGEEASLRALLDPHRSKLLRSACVKLKLNLQRRASVHDNKTGYIDLLCKYHSDKADGEQVALTRPTKAGGGAGAKEVEPRATQHDAFRLINILCSPKFVDRMFEADKNQCRSNIDKHAINEDSDLWRKVTHDFNEDRENYNGLERKEREQYRGIHPAIVARHSVAKLLDMWRKLTSRYTVARGKSKLSGHNESDLYRYYKGRVDLLYLYDWLQIRPNQLDGIRGRISKRAQMSTLEGSIERTEDTSLEEGGGGKKAPLSPIDRIAKVIELEHEEEVAERSSSYAPVTDTSTTVQSALTTLKMLKDSNASKAMVREVENTVDVLVHRWMLEMDPR